MESTSRVPGLRPLVLVVGLVVGFVVVGHGYVWVSGWVSRRWSEYEVRLVSRAVGERLGAVAIEEGGKVKLASDVTRGELEKLFFVCHERVGKLEVKMQIARESLEDGGE